MALMVARMNRVTQINARKHRENVCLEASDKELKRCERHGRDQGHNCQTDADYGAHGTGAEDRALAKRNDKATKDLEGDVTRQHVGEEPHSVT